MTIPPDRIAIGYVGAKLDAGDTEGRWRRWRPTVGLCQQPKLPIARFELLYQRAFVDTAQKVARDIARVSPRTVVALHEVELTKPWDFESVYAALHDWARGYHFRDDAEYLVHISTGTHVVQICWFLLTESRHIPGRLVQSSPERAEGPRGDGPHADVAGTAQVIDLDLSRYDQIASRFQKAHDDTLDALKSGIATRNETYNALIAEIGRVAVASTDPILLEGPTGAGKTQLAERIYGLRRARHRVKGPLVTVNCATLRGDGAMSALFGHVKGSFTGALSDRPGLLRAAHEGMLFLDEIGELGGDEQAMLLRALEHGRFYPMGSDREVASAFQLVGGTHADLSRRVREGRFREDLLARINLWTFRLPGLAARREDIAPNLDHELERVRARMGVAVSFSREARQKYLAFAVSPEAVWRGNFRDFAASVTRMATLAPGGRIDVATVDAELTRLRALWGDRSHHEPSTEADPLAGLDTGPLDRFDAVQLAEVVRVCRATTSLAEAGRALFAASRAQRSTVNDGDRLRKYLARFSLTWERVRGEVTARS